MQKYMHLQVNFLQLVLVEIILWCDSAGDTVTHCSPKRAYGFHGTPSKFHCLSSIPLILAYNVYSQVNWTGTSLWLWRSLLRGSEAVLLPKRKTSTASERGAAVLPVTVHEWLCDGGIWKKGLLRVYFQSWWCLYDKIKSLIILDQFTFYKLNYVGVKIWKSVALSLFVLLIKWSVFLLFVHVWTLTVVEEI